MADFSSYYYDIVKNPVWQILFKRFYFRVFFEVFLFPAVVWEEGVAFWGGDAYGWGCVEIFACYVDELLHFMAFGEF